jgi:putative nucleotidyltransferase with HDIG domain
MTTLTLEVERKLATAVERMPAFPKSVQRILELTRDINCLPKDLVSVIEKDPVMTMKILRVINSAYYSLPAKITSVGQSVVYLGLNTVKNLALSFAAVGMLPRMTTAGFDIQAYLMHSLTTATMARQLASVYCKGQTEVIADCYIAGLLHDFGKVVFAQFMVAEFCQVLAISVDENKPLHVAEAEIIGADHAYVGALLATKWQFPEHLVECIRNHHNEQAAPTPLMDCIRMANQISRKLALGNGGHAWQEGEPCAAPKRFGEDIDAVIVALGDMDKIVGDAQMFAQVGSAS